MRQKENESDKSQPRRHFYSHSFSLSEFQRRSDRRLAVEIQPKSTVKEAKNVASINNQRLSRDFAFSLIECK
jgi:hypothetical protein